MKEKTLDLLRPQMRPAAGPGFFIAFSLAAHAARFLSRRSYAMENPAFILLGSNPVYLRISFYYWVSYIN